MAPKRAEIITVALSALSYDPELQPRAAERADLVNKYARDYALGAQFPPVTAFRVDGKLLLADGFHRIRARERNGYADVQVEVKPGDRRDAIMFSRVHNATHGAPFTSADKKRAVLTFLRDTEWSLMGDREIGRRLGVDHKTISKYRRDLERQRNPPGRPDPSKPRTRSEQAQERAYAKAMRQEVGERLQGEIHNAVTTLDIDQIKEIITEWWADVSNGGTVTFHPPAPKFQMLPEPKPKKEIRTKH